MSADPNSSSRELILLYRIDTRLYVNVTPKCTARCVFCPRETRPVVHGIDLSLPSAPPADAYAEELESELKRWQPEEIVFCGFGEPTLRLRLLKRLATIARRRGVRTRLDTNGHGSLIHGRPILRGLVGLLDAISISLNAADTETYERVMRPRVTGAFEGTLAFIEEAVELIPEVTVTAVTGLPDVDEEALRRLVLRLGARFRGRPLGRIG